ncbi:transcriptional regulator [Sorangium cellulosum]|uniref:Transcriptional regulator n=1 Tax=Sorangium cellulosum TaxID=56 RepID=A0A4P2QC64_SORCE|nr:response regulator [Sorangium cellulosum]AUX27229.1 transcriptional regulator [Sorangium cellulosum]
MTDRGTKAEALEGGAGARPERAKEPPPSVLIVDDMPANLSLLTSMLTAQGYEVRAAISGAMALMSVAAEPPDLILLDVSMPHMDGYEVCRRLKAEPRTADIPVIFLSAMTGIGDKVTAFEAGGVDYVTKPFELREVLARVETQLLLHRQRRELERQRAELEARYAQICQLHAALRGYLSDRAWESIEESVSSNRPSPPAREVLTVLVSDIEDFVRLSEREDPGPLLADLSLYMATVAQVVYDHGGEVDKYVGDGMLAFFRSAPDALAAAERIQRAIAAFNERQRAEGRPAFPTRLGLSTGPVVLASIGSSGRREFTIIGDRVNTAFRIQAQARPGGLLMDEATFAAAGSPGSAAPVLMRIRGKQGEERLYAISPEAAREDVEQARTPAPGGGAAGASR